MSLAGKIALVTGASRGIGRAIALELARRGATVVGTATTAAGAESITAYLADAGNSGRGYALDVADPASIEAALAAITDAGLTPQDIDGIVRCDMDLVRSNDLVDALGMTRLDYYGDAGPGGVAPTAQVAQAMAAVISGLATNVLVYRSLNGRSGRRFGRHHGRRAGCQVYAFSTFPLRSRVPEPTITEGEEACLQPHRILCGQLVEHLHTEGGDYPQQAARRLLAPSQGA